MSSKTIHSIGSCLLATLMTMLATDQSNAQHGKWIWSPEQDAFQIKSGTCYFRKKIHVGVIEKGDIHITANETFELYLNGRLVGKGKGPDQLTKYDLSNRLVQGTNTIAVKVTNSGGPPAGLVAEIRWQEKGWKKWKFASTDDSWKTGLNTMPLWVHGFYNDRSWSMAKVLQDGFEQEPEQKRSIDAVHPEMIVGSDQKNSHRAVSASLNDALTSTRKDEQQLNAPRRKPSDQDEALAPPSNTRAIPKVDGSRVAMNDNDVNDEVPITSPEAFVEDVKKAPISTIQETTAKATDSRFTVSEEFKVEQIADKAIGSLIAMSFDEFGRIVASREGGPLVLMETNRHGKIQGKPEIYCDLVESCQGILPLNGDVYVTGQGPDGLALYHLVDQDRDGILEVATPLVKFKGQLGEHGPHGLTLGPDGMIYAIIGNGSGIEGPSAKSSPYSGGYDVDMVKRYEDPGGHANGVKAPGGTVVRISLDGKFHEVFAGGIRNAYDLAFDGNGEMFVHDSDMESEEGMKWYRQTRLYHVIPGAELGWRSGWAKYPDYYPDNVPPIAQTGRGSPSGAVCYNHIMFPLRFHNSLFLGDWSEGKIWNVQLTQSGSGFKTKIETFLQADQLTVTDLCVGPDGGLYFCTGGRGTDGAIYKVTWRGEVPDKYAKLKDAKDRLSRQPQFNAAWARQDLAKLQVEMENKWGRTLRRIIKDVDGKVEYRLRALEIMALYGPIPDTVTLSLLADDDHELIRGRAAMMLGLLEREEAEMILKKLLGDESSWVRRQACHSLVRLECAVTWQEIERNLISIDKNESWAARRLLFAQPSDQWKDAILKSENPRLFVQGTIALMEADPSIENAYGVLVRVAELLDGHLDKQTQLDVLRVTQLALGRCKVDHEKIPAFTEKLAELFPLADGAATCELSSILCFLNAHEIDQKVAEYLNNSKHPRTEKIKTAMNFVSLAKSFSGDAKIALIQYLEEAKSFDGGGNYKAFLSSASGEVGKTLDRETALKVLANADRWPSAAAESLYAVYHSMDEDASRILIEADRKLNNKSGSEYDRIKAGLLAVLSKGGAGADDYLREVWRKSKDRRDDVVLALAQNPQGENWNYLVASLGEISDTSSKDVLEGLTKINRRPRDMKYYREVIRIGMRLGHQGAHEAVNLLEHWSAQKITLPEDPWKTRIEAWRNWFHENHPNLPTIELESVPTSKWNIDELLETLNENPGNANHGRTVFAKANCIKCHRYGTEGDSMGPDLTRIAKRFSDREILESILLPSKVISDQYRSKTVLTMDGKTHLGIVAKNRDGSTTVLTKEGSKIEFKKTDIDEIAESKESAMPGDTIDPLTKSEIADLMAYLKGTRHDSAKKSGSALR